MQRQREPVTLKTTNVGGLEDEKLVVKTPVVKFQSIKALSTRKGTSGFIHEECFDTHIGLSVLEIYSGVV